MVDVAYWNRLRHFTWYRKTRLTSLGNCKERSFSSCTGLFAIENEDVCLEAICRRRMGRCTCVYHGLCRQVTVICLSPMLRFYNRHRRQISRAGRRLPLCKHRVCERASLEVEVSLFGLVPAGDGGCGDVLTFPFRAGGRRRRRPLMPWAMARACFPRGRRRRGRSHRRCRQRRLWASPAGASR